MYSLYTTLKKLKKIELRGDSANMKFTELTVKEYETFVQNPSLESHYFQVTENIKTRENDGFEVVLLGVKDESNKVIAASLFSKIPTMGSYVYYSNRGPVMDYSDLGLVDFT